MILTHRAVLAMSTFRIHLLSPRVPEESRVATKDCCEIHEKIRVFLESFFFANLPDEILTKYTMIQEIWQHPREWQREKELKKVRAENHCKQYQYLAFSGEQEGKVVTMETVQMSMTNNHAAGIGTCTQSGMTIPSYLSSEMHLGKFLYHTEFQSWRVNELQNRSWLKNEKIAWHCSGKRNRNSQIDGWPHHSKINYWQKLPRLWRIGFDDGGSIEEMLR